MKIKYRIIFAVSITIFLISVTQIVSSYTQSIKEQNHLQELASIVDREQVVDTGQEIKGTPQETETQATDPEMPGTEILPQYKTLYETNQDIIGWIKIEGTGINYPVMQTVQENEYYIRRGFDKQYAGSGLPFLDSACDLDSPNTIFMIYGHNMKNGTLFADILKYKDKEFWESHPTIQFDTLYEHQEYQIFSVFYSKVYSVEEDVFRYHQFFSADTSQVFYDFVDNVNALALYDTGVQTEWGDQLLTLSTCSYHTENGRFAIVARKIET